MALEILPDLKGKDSRPKVLPGTLMSGESPAPRPRPRASETGINSLRGERPHCPVVTDVGRPWSKAFDILKETDIQSAVYCAGV